MTVMKPRLLYNLLNLLSVIAAFGAVVFVVLGIIGFVIDQKLRGDLFGSAFWLLVSAMLLRAIWDIGTRLIRMEERQYKLMRDSEGTDK